VEWLIVVTIGPAFRRAHQQEGLMLGLDMLRAVAGMVAIASMSAATNGAAQEFPSPGKTIMMQIGFNPGGGTDAAGLLIAKYLKKYLPNDPSIALQHMPGPGGMTALNHVVLRTPPDGMLTIMGGASALDPFNTRKANAKYDPTKFRIIGGIGRGGSALVITAEGEKRLYDESKPPAVMGSSGPIPRQGMQVVLWDGGRSRFSRGGGKDQRRLLPGEPHGGREIHQDARRYA
jgi:hypothetical protein